MEKLEKNDIVKNYIDKNGLPPILDSNGNYNPERAILNQKDSDVFAFEEEKKKFETELLEFNNLLDEFKEIQKNFIYEFVDNNIDVTSFILDDNPEQSLADAKVSSLNNIRMKIGMLKKNQEILKAKKDSLLSKKNEINDKYSEDAISEDVTKEILDKQLDELLDKEVEKLIDTQDTDIEKLPSNIL